MTSVAVAAPVSLLARRPEGPLLRFLFWSALVHAVLFSLALVWAKLHEAPAIDLDQKPIKATLVRQGTPRDEKLLPRIEQPPPPPMEQKAPEAAPAPEPVRPVAPSPIPAPAPPKTRQAGEKKADPRQKLMGAFDRMSKSKAADTTGAADGDPNGDSAVAEGEAYYARLKSQITRFYDVSQTIPDSERIRLTAQVAVVISPAGQLEKARLAKSSGNDLFDSAVMAAVKRAAPFAPPPTHLRDALSKYGVVLQFRP
ncbi:MAG TPA: energy transducer TonB [Myxococcaceae bacterium]|nr:energy transducer TonB [Myxococcaceae bacterium]